MDPTVLLLPFIFALFIILSVIFTVKQQTAAVLERLGKFHSIRQPGLHFKIPFLDRVAGRINLKIQTETKTQGNLVTMTTRQGNLMPMMRTFKVPLRLTKTSGQSLGTT